MKYVEEQQNNEMDEVLGFIHRTFLHSQENSTYENKLLCIVCVRGG